jgi:hypothetical protein
MLQHVSAADPSALHAQAEDWMRLVKRWWACSEPWCELNAFSL